MSTIATASRIETIDTLAKHYANARRFLKERVDALAHDLADLHKRKRPGILSALEDAKYVQQELIAAIQAAPELFTQPRTMALHGIKVGFSKGTGRMSWDDDDADVVARIEKLFADSPEQLALLINTTKEPSKDGLKTLDAKALKRLGITIEGTGDVVVVKATNGEVDKIVKKILKEGSVEEAQKEVA